MRPSHASLTASLPMSWGFKTGTASILQARQLHSVEWLLDPKIRIIRNVHMQTQITYVICTICNVCNSHMCN